MKKVFLLIVVWACLLSCPFSVYSQSEGTKPDKPQLRIIEVVESEFCGSWGGVDIIFEYTGDGATSFALYHSIKDFSGIVWTPLPVENNTCRINCIDEDSENYFILKAVNQFGSIEADVLVYGDIFTSIAQINIDNISVYPNPAKDFIFIKQNFSGKKYQVSIFNPSGQLMMKTFVTDKNEKILLTSLPKGLYILKVELPDDNFSKVFKFIKIE